MPKDILDQVWDSWRGFVREVTSGFVPALKYKIRDLREQDGGLPIPHLKTTLQPPKKSQLVRDVTKLRRPFEAKVADRKADRTILSQKEMVPVRTADSVRKKPVTAAEKVTRRVDPPKPFDIDERYLETPKERRERVDKANYAEEKKKLRNRFSHTHVSKLRRHLLFSNPGTQSLMAAHRGFVKGISAAEMPQWTNKVLPALTFDAKNLYLDGLPWASDKVKRSVIKDLYFNPKEASTIQPITDKLRDQFANISRGNVRHILRTLETYQRNYRRRRPPKVLSRMSMTKPGVILTDMFFPSVHHGWRKFGGCVTMMDAWSRYVGCYAVERKTKSLVKKAMETFMRDFAGPRPFTAHGPYGPGVRPGSREGGD